MRLTSLIFASILSTLVNAQDTEIIFRGDAFDVTSGELLYQEIHQLVVASNSQPLRETVTYVNAEGNQIGRKSLDYQSLMAPNYTVSYELGDKSETVVNSGAAIKVSASKQKSLPVPSNLFAIDAGFHYLILSQFEQLLAGNTVTFDFLFTGRATFIEMKIKPNRSEGQLNLNLSLSNFLLSALVKPIELTYDINTKRLLRYQGLTNITNNEGKLIVADIRYSYPPTMIIPNLASMDID